MLTGLELWQIQDQELDYMNQPLDLPPEKSSAQRFPQTFLERKSHLYSYVICDSLLIPCKATSQLLVKMQPLLYGHNTVQRSIPLFLVDASQCVREHLLCGVLRPAAKKLVHV